MIMYANKRVESVWAGNYVMHSGLKRRVRVISGLAHSGNCLSCWSVGWVLKRFLTYLHNSETVSSKAGGRFKKGARTPRQTPRPRAPSAVFKKTRGRGVRAPALAFVESALDWPFEGKYPCA